MNAILIISILFILGVLVWALFGGKETAAKAEDPKLKDATFRRRASDRLIEKEFPDETEAERGGDGGGERRGPERRGAATQEAAQDGKSSSPFKLPYHADEIIPETSRFRIYRRTLINSEVYAQKGDFDTAISLYEGVRTRINDTDVRMKIEADIEYLKFYKKRKEYDKKRREDETKREMQRAESGKESKSSDIKLTIDGSVPENISIGNMPETINIGIIDPTKNLDPDAIAEKVKEKLQHLTDPRHEDERKMLRKEIENLKEKVEEIDRTKGLTDSDMKRIEWIKEDIDNTLEKGDIGALKSLKDEINDLKEEINEIQRQRIAEANAVPAPLQVKYDSPIPITLDTKPIMELLDRLPKIPAPEAVPLKEPAAEEKLHEKKKDEETSAQHAGPDATTTEKVLEKEKKADEDEDDFELLSDYGKDKFDDRLSDEEIFEKILNEKDENEEKSFEVIGDKRDESDEVNLTDTELASKKREEDSFYQKLLATDRRKKKELPILKVSYDFTRLPDDASLSREKNILEYAFYKYKPLLIKANDFIKKRKVRDAINYYKVVMAQNIPPEFKVMIRKNISDLTDYLEKYLTWE